MENKRLLEERTLMTEDIADLKNRVILLSTAIRRELVHLLLIQKSKKEKMKVIQDLKGYMNSRLVKDYNGPHYQAPPKPSNWVIHKSKGVKKVKSQIDSICVCGVSLRENE